jgi:lysophospholipase L1-like esterase
MGTEGVIVRRIRPAHTVNMRASLAALSGWALLVVGLLSSSPALAQRDSTAQQKVRYADAIEAFLKEDLVNPPPKHAIEFVGSSIFRQWTNLKEQMAPLPVFNRAFGGSRTGDQLTHMDKVVLPYEPRIIVYYCGSNDINAGDQPRDIFLRFKQFSDRVNERLPAAVIYYVSINKAPQKKARWSAVDSTNMFAKELCESTKGRFFIDVNPVLVDAAGNPRLELYRDDLLHFKDPAYEEFTKVIKPTIERAWKGTQK